MSVGVFVCMCTCVDAICPLGVNDALTPRVRVLGVMLFHFLVRVSGDALLCTLTQREDRNIVFLKGCRHHQL